MLPLLMLVVRAAVRQHLNDPSVCGYNFLPYATLEAIRSRFGLTVAGDFTIEWARSSYVSQRAWEASRADDAVALGEQGRGEGKGGTIGRFDYSLLAASTRALPKGNWQAGAMWV